MSTVEGVGVQELGPTGSDQDGEVSVLAPGDIERLQAFDGLFLRAEHLNLIQDYAAKLAMSVGAAGGPGVVEGYDVVLKQGELAVGPGLAIDPSGRPLLSRAEVTLPLGGLQPGLDTFWYVEAVGDGEPTGNEPVQGLLCDEPCDGGTTRAPVLAERVRIRLTRAVEPDLTTWTDDQKRSRLTSRLFATEQRRAGAWSRVPGDPGAGLADRSWLPARAASGRDPAVRLGVLIPDGDLQKWQVDVWAVRRDRGDPPPTRLWQWRLGMRPWDVFVAQVLQFQHMFGLVDVTTLTDSVLAQLDAIAAIIPQERQTKAHSAALVTGLREFIAAGDPTVPSVTSGAGVGLSQRGVVELPPAGFLPYDGGLDGVERTIGELLGNGVRIRVCTCRPVDVALAVQQGQHRDRIALDVPERPADVDVLVPVTDDGRPAFDWVAFVRREAVSCGTPAAKDRPDVVAVSMLDVGDDRAAHAAALAALRDGSTPDGVHRLGDLEYPTRAWAVPQGPAYDAIYGAVATAREQSDVLAVALVTEEGRGPLGALRAERLAVTFTDGGALLPEVNAFVGPASVEAVVLLFSTFAAEVPEDPPDPGPVA